MKKELFNIGWKFSNQPGKSLVEMMMGGNDDRIDITLPYDAMIREKVVPDTKNAGQTGFYPGGMYFYTKEFRVPEEWRDKTVYQDHFDFSLVDGLIAQARMHGMHIGFLWFGAWKNAQCLYAPTWVKCDINRFWRAEVKRGQNKVNLEKFYGMPYTTLSAHCEETKKADAKAFAMLMRHLKEVDEKEQIVLLVQVENETGLQGATREHSEYADELFSQNVPEDFVSYMKEHTSTMSEDVKAAVEEGKDSGNWSEVFGMAAEEIFHAYSVASYVETVAAAGI